MKIYSEKLYTLLFFSVFYVLPLKRNKKKERSNMQKLASGNFRVLKKMKPESKSCFREQGATFVCRRRKKIEK